jgi:Aminotransferase class I and II
MPYFPATQRYSLPYRAIEVRRQREILAHAADLPATLGSPTAVACGRWDGRVEDRLPACDQVRIEEAGFGAQGGDPSRGVDMDLSTCVNRYGPAPAAIAALHSISPADILLHPYDAAQRLVDLYRWATGIRDGAMIAGRGASEFIWAMGRELDPAEVHVPLPAYTDYLKAFPGRGFSLAGEQIPSVEQVDAALDQGGLVIISNPHNPTGTVLDPKDLIAAADAHPAATLVVDESYVNFTADPIRWSTLACDVPNLVVLRSTSKFYGIAAMRAGIAWCADHERLKRLFGNRRTGGCPVSTSMPHAPPCATFTGRRTRGHGCTPTARGWPRCCPTSKVSTLDAIPTSTSSTRSVPAPKTLRRCFSVTASECACSVSPTVCTLTRCGSSRRAPMSANASPRRSPRYARNSRHHSAATLLN